MLKERKYSLLLKAISEHLLSIDETECLIEKPENILIIVKQLSIGETIAFIPSLNSIKKQFPSSKITLITNNKNDFIFNNCEAVNKKSIFKITSLLKINKVIKVKYDFVLTPEISKFSFISSLLSRISNSKIKIGIDSIDGELNPYRLLFNKKIKLNWSKQPDIHNCEKFIEINNKINIRNDELFFPNVHTSDEYITTHKIILEKINKTKDEFLIGINIGSQNQINRWSLEKVVSLIKKINSDYPVKFYIAGNFINKESYKYVSEKSGIKIFNFINKPYSLTSALIEQSDLFITNDCEIMHIAGVTSTPQISLFGCSNPFTWSPFGKKKMFIRKSDLIDDISVDDVFSLVKLLLIQKPKVKTLAG